MKDFSYVEIQSEYFHVMCKMQKDGRALKDRDIHDVMLSVKRYKSKEPDWQFDELISGVLDECGIAHEVLCPDQIIRV